jgi:hypothetical protein
MRFHILRPAFLFGVFSCAVLCAAKAAPPDAAPSAEAIMARVAANQDQAEAERLRYVYVQHARMTSGKGRTVFCEELTDYRITPSSEGSHDELLKLDGRVRVKGKYISYHSLDKDENQNGAANDNDPVSVEIGGEYADRAIVENMRESLMHDQSKDGINAHLFPLTSKEQSNYIFHLVGRERLNGRDVVRITFSPKDKSEFGWTGDAYIDDDAFQPVLVTTGMARKVPFAVRTLLGTNLPGLGFTVVYAPQPDGVWFPVSFSSEFKIHVLFFFNRQIVLNAEDREFEKTHGTATILDGATPVPPSQP